MLIKHAHDLGSLINFQQHKQWIIWLANFKVCSSPPAARATTSRIINLQGPPIPTQPMFLIILISPSPPSTIHPLKFPRLLFHRIRIRIRDTHHTNPPHIPRDHEEHFHHLAGLTLRVQNNSIAKTVHRGKQFGDSLPCTIGDFQSCCAFWDQDQRGDVACVRL